jgi:hypothetical protein
MTKEQIARVCHDANASFCSVIGDNSQKPWDEAEEWQRQSAINGVEYAIKNPNAPPSSQHEALAQRQEDGWVEVRTNQGPR